MEEEINNNDVSSSNKKIKKLPQKNQDMDKKPIKDIAKNTLGEIINLRINNSRGVHISSTDYNDNKIARSHNRSMNEIKCQNLIKQEQKYYMYNNHSQGRLERNIKKYRKRGKYKYNEKILYYKKIVEGRNEYLDHLYNVSRKIENKSINEYLKLKKGSINLRQAKETVDDIKIPNNIQKQDVKNTLKTIFKKRIRRFNFNIPILTLGDIIHARRHNKSIREVYCQNLIEKERLHLLHKSNYHQDRLDRNVKKYKKKQKSRYEKRIGQHWAKVQKRQEYQDLLYTTSRAIDNKVIDKYKNIDQITEEYDVPMNELHTNIQDGQEQDTLRQNHQKIEQKTSKDKLTDTNNKTETKNNQETERKISKSEPTLTNDKKETNNSQEAQQKLKENLVDANKSFDKNEKKLKDSTSPERC